MAKTFYKRDNCRLCKSENLELVLPLAPSPLCDAYIQADRLDEVQESYPLELYQCRNCGYVFLPYVVDPEIIYRDYIYVTTSSLGLSEHFKGYADQVCQKLKPAKGSLAVDIGSNDGTLLGCFQQNGMRVLGVEPARAIAREATRLGIETLDEFFSAGLAEEIIGKHGKAAIVTINNLFANIDDLDVITSGVRKLLADDGVLVIESSYLGDMIRNMVFDFAYHEHLSYFSVKPLIRFFASFELELFDVEHVPTKGGSLRYYVQLRGASRPVSPAVKSYVDHEDKTGLDRREVFDSFFERIETLKKQVVDKLAELRAGGFKLAGFGGSATTTTLLHHFGIGQMLDYIVDDNPGKQGTFSPGLHIPVIPPEALLEKSPDYVVVLAWRYFDQIITKHAQYLEQGGHFIRPVPVLEIVGKERG